MSYPEEKRHCLIRQCSLQYNITRCTNHLGSAHANQSETDSNIFELDAKFQVSNVTFNFAWI